MGGPVAFCCYLAGGSSIVLAGLVVLFGLADAARSPAAATSALSVAAGILAIGLALCALGSLLSLITQIRDHLRALHDMVRPKPRGDPGGKELR